MALCVSAGFKEAVYFWCLVLLICSFSPVKSHVDNYSEATVCDGDTQKIHCAPAEDIHILQTFYGKWRNHDCHGTLSVKDNIPTCNVERPKSTAIIRDLCQGANSCKLFAHDSIYGNPCPDVKKYLYVTYFCLPSHLKSKKTKATPSLTSIPLNEVRGFLRQTIAKDSDVFQDGDENSGFPTSIDDLPGTSDLLFTPLIKVLQLASDDLYPPNKALHSIKICNGESKNVVCQPTQRIKVKTAFYGKKNGQDCHGKLPYKDDSPTCSALDAKYNVEKSCEGRRFCLLHANEAEYGRSLCPNVNKYLSVSYFCEEPPVFKARSSVVTPEVDYEEDAVTRSKIRAGYDNIPRTIRLCNGHRRTLSCQSKTKTMTIHEAFYGKRNGQDCRGAIHYKDNVPECRKNTAFDSIHYLCNGRQSCDLSAESALFGDDPCPGINKYLEVRYSC